MPNPVGRPPLFSSPEELQGKLDAYFLKCEQDRKLEKEKATEQKRPIDPTEGMPMITDLCVFLGTNRQTLLEYEREQEFADTIKNAKAKMEAALEKNLYRKGKPVGEIFSLSANYKWQNVQRHAVAGDPDNSTPIPVSAVDKTIAEIDSALKK